MLRISEIEAIERKLLEVSSLIDLFKVRSLDFVTNLISWIEEVDQLLQRNRLPVAGKVATLRGQLIAVQQGREYPSISIKGKRTQRKVLYAAAHDVLNKITDLISETIHNDRLRIDEAERIGSQIIAVAHYYNIIQKDLLHKPLDSYKVILSELKAHEATQQGMVQLEGTLNQRDVALLLRRIIIENDQTKMIE